MTMTTTTTTTDDNDDRDYDDRGDDGGVLSEATQWYTYIRTYVITRLTL